ncbi:MAG: formylglycine-generating enzyme family protein [Anaerolineales bacterium]|mgnify:FL=1|jgi:formylglycine-generating enzyme required for sulfatase activity|nr:SUMF1/EgtB/PvdO family nonheme iron enzyme [Anaerolineales bacterium]OQY83258.1 MAG: hypothetical protein B6D40_07300 [Anaerolineae bacterium UTCFX3]GER78275.1 conserved hypothetical protein [Candidatus Denitrolinea symbiosum]GIK10313.1 MAG: hypothetical protein BroJett001_23790 [Chloroflexota bacterium]MCZ2290282.1 formylglycine-generating enzyme family protein [Anaerolineales bacterium]
MKSPYRWIAALIVLLLAAFGLYKIPSPVSTFLHQKVRYARAYVASFDGGAAIPVTPAGSRVASADGMTQVLVPAGEFLMGAGEEGAQRSRPAHEVSLPAYWVDQTEVTNAMYARCRAAGACPHPGGAANPYFGKSKYDDYPVVYVSWNNAEKYCLWAGRRLPTEAEWEKAARGTDGRAYPWGDDPPDMRLANFDFNLGAPLPADRYPLGASPYGALNMAGNVREWTADWFHNYYYVVSPRENPQGPPTGDLKSLRGGSFSDGASELRAFHRFSHHPLSGGINRGFRCVSDAD